MKPEPSNTPCREFSLFTFVSMFEVKRPRGEQFPRNLGGKIPPIYCDLPMVYLMADGDKTVDTIRKLIKLR